MQYLVGQLLACLLAAGLLGLLIGWFLWGMLVRKLREHSTDLEQRVSKLTGYPARLTDMEATHAAYVASKNEEDAKSKARIAELEPLAAKAPELEKSLAAKTIEWDGVSKQLAGKTSEWAALQAKLSGLETQHTAAMNTAGQVPDLTNRLRASVARVAELEGAVKAKDVQLVEQSGRVSSLSQKVAALDPVAQRVPQLEAQLAQHVDAQHEKDEHIEQLMGQVDELQPIVAHVPHLTAKLKQHEQAHAAKDLRIAELAPLADLMGQKDQHIGALLSRVEELQPGAAQVTDLQEQVNQFASAHAKKDARLADAEHERQVANHKLRMAETAVAMHAGEIAKLQDQISALKIELENAKQAAMATPVPLARAAAAAAGAGALGAAAVRGFFDVNEGSAPPAPATTEDPVREDYEKRLEELRTGAAAKDDELAKLRSKLTDVEAAPDPDTKRQILLAAKNAELTHLRGVLNSLFQPVSQDEVAKRAFSYAQERGFSGAGSAREDWLRAERDTHFSRLTYAWESTRTGTMF